MTRAALSEYAAAVRWQYLAAGKKEKGRILDEFCCTTGLHRKAAIRLLGGRDRGAGAGRRKKGRPVRYGPELMAPLKQIWEAQRPSVRKAAGGGDGRIGDEP